MKIVQATDHLGYGYEDMYRIVNANLPDGLVYWIKIYEDEDISRYSRTIASYGFGYIASRSELEEYFDVLEKYNGKTDLELFNAMSPIQIFKDGRLWLIDIELQEVEHVDKSEG